MSEKFTNTCLKASLALAFLLILQVSFAQKKAAGTASIPAVNSALESRKSLLGKEYSIVIAVADSVVYQLTTGDAANARIPASIGAASQLLTTALLLQLADEGKIALDDPVSKHLPIFESYRRNYVTIRHCLTHLTGLGKETFHLSSLFEKSKFNTISEELPGILKKEVHANAGEQFRYSPYGTIVAAGIVEAVTKKRFDQVIRTRLFVPLGMRNTSFTTDDGSAPNPATGARSTAADMAKFLQMLLKKGKAGDKQVLSEAAVDEMRKVQVSRDLLKAAPKGTEPFSFALGSWETEGSAAQGSPAATLSVPGWNGAWTSVDFSRGYAFVLLPKEFSGEQKAETYLELKKVMDQQVLVKNR